MRKRIGDRLEGDHTLVITLRGTNQPYCKFKPGYSPGIGPFVSVYRCSTTAPDEDGEHVLTFGVGGIMSILRWLPLVINHARRMESAERLIKSDRSN